MVEVSIENAIDSFSFANKVMQTLWSTFSQNKWWDKVRMCIGTNDEGYLYVYFMVPDQGNSVYMKIQAVRGEVM